MVNIFSLTASLCCVLGVLTACTATSAGEDRMLHAAIAAMLPHTASAQVVFVEVDGRDPAQGVLAGTQNPQLLPASSAMSDCADIVPSTKCSDIPQTPEGTPGVLLKLVVSEMSDSSAVVIAETYFGASTGGSYTITLTPADSGQWQVDDVRLNWLA